ncbi:hypothetical protein NDU88_004038 [Pleurodeles waltl]|uniref:Uncharacterized protein n=1 Tax=Pleurodeles waltl TaxID=8319 RepID=A0AAV7M555_PLEWA|nr:hypothetical protein NDU88_004038 [Pleurodeles waltl]
MRSEALKRGKDWLRKKMEDTTPEGGPSLTEDQQAFTGLEIGDLQEDREQTPKPSKRQKSAGKPARKPSKRTRAPERDTASPVAPKTPESNSSHKSTDGEHISAIIKECLKSITPLLFKKWRPRVRSRLYREREEPRKPQQRGGIRGAGTGQRPGVPRVSHASLGHAKPGE